MELNELFNFKYLIIAVIFIISVTMLILISHINILIIADIKNKDICLKLNIKYMFNLININRQLYPAENSKNNDKKEGMKNNIDSSILLADDLLSIYRLLKKIKIHELYSNINFGTENIGLTSSVYVLINTLYGNLFNIIDAEKMYLNVNPDFTKDFVLGNIRIHIRPRIKALFNIIIMINKIMNKNKGNKEGDSNESNRFDTESYGNNS
ncbi:DUF2953 domain-containing protein [Clostridioides difficile]|uniref:DUF2953 domain-containing protein n=2 Tax=Clostridioides difficile TaxID=1496 RepID=UPI0009800BEF|nr:DUF2953 domain-containing protein [Clostridioides difficile]EGT4968143.1 DUF2953 domain-containing protein [Clostridioides difficile]MBY2229457.1 DUF2953 domain-containing protein [Clostridioides difficile]MCJ0143620.1 DUF2953 domain-containing protein [Clostridioides difficile]MCR1463690.1 DUF2953 domain-containing protein [Clostridioides difficile]MDB0490788.1 DUF2953 domain-containing protein [Clostridioides difficile]